jgi:hypothetical protein
MAKLEVHIDCTQYVKLYRKALSEAWCILFESSDLDEILNINGIDTMEDDE